MTSGLQPPASGAPVPVPGVTGGPPVLGGQISNDQSTGAVVVAPNPGNVLQVRKGGQPTSFQVYEYFNSNTSYSRLALNSQTNGPFSLAVETAPTSVIRALNITANGNITINGAAVIIPVPLQVSNVGVPTNTATLNLSGGNLAANNFSIIFSNGPVQPWALIANNNSFSPTATNAYDIGGSSTRVRTVYANTVDLAAVGQGNGATATLGLVRGTGFGPIAVAMVGWIQLVSGGTQIYVPYWT